MILAPRTAEQRTALRAFLQEHMPYYDPEGAYQHLLGVVRGDELVAVGCWFDGRDGNWQAGLASTTPRWATPPAMAAVIGYPFFVMRARRCTAITTKQNQAMRRLLEGVGFVREGAMRAWYADGADAILYGMTRRWFERSKWAAILERGAEQRRAA